MDPLSDVLRLLRPAIHGASGFDMGGDWSIDFPSHTGIKCYSIVSGQCWILVDDSPGPLLLSAGDCFVLPRGLPFRLASDLRLPSMGSDGCERNGRIEVFQEGGGCFIAGGHFALGNVHADLLIHTLPAFIHVRDPAGRASLRWSIETMREELSRQAPGAELASEHLAHMVLIQALRIHMEAGEAAEPGWLLALADRQIGATIKAIHSNPGHGWTLPSLAEQAGMSRSGFAARFRALVGEAPMSYVTRWRMMLASDRLTTSGDPVSIVARSFGYNSESAFSVAFKRVMGSPPRAISRRRGPLTWIDNGLAPERGDDVDGGVAGQLTRGEPRPTGAQSVIDRLDTATSLRGAHRRTGRGHDASDQDPARRW